MDMPSDQFSNPKLGELLLSYLVRLEQNPTLEATEYLQDKPDVSLEERDAFLIGLQLHMDLKKVFAGPNDDEASHGPKELGRFKILREIGMGGCARVFLADDPVLKRQVAIKVPHMPLAFSREMGKRLLQEAQVTAQLRHPGIVPFHEIGESDGTYFLVYGYCSGGSLQDWLEVEDNFINSKDAAWLIARVATAVHEAHQVGILHRDLKPSNVLLVPVEENDAPFHFPFDPVVTDFGLAKVLENMRDENVDYSRMSTMTIGCMPIGTPMYMSPEQASGKNKELTPATDVYALGVMIYELIVGRSPFTGTELEIFQQIRDLEVIEPHKLRPNLPLDLSSVCMKCLEKDPANRYQSALELASDLRRFIDGEATLARPVSSFRKVVKWGRKRPAITSLVVLASLALLLLVVGIIWHIAQINHYVTEQNLANKELIEANQKYKQAKAVADEEKDRALEQAYLGIIWRANDMLRKGSTEHIRATLNQARPKPGERDLRGFEWYYLWKQGGLLTNLEGHTQELLTVSISPDNNIIASGGRDGKLVFWDLATCQQKMAWEFKNTSILEVNWSPNQQYVFIKIHNDKSGQHRVIIKEFPRGLTLLDQRIDHERLRGVQWSKESDFVVINITEANGHALILCDLKDCSARTLRNDNHKHYLSYEYSDDGAVLLAYVQDNGLFAEKISTLNGLQLESKRISSNNLIEETSELVFDSQSDTVIELNNGQDISNIEMFDARQGLKSLNQFTCKEKILRIAIHPSKKYWAYVSERVISKDRTVIVAHVMDFESNKTICEKVFEVTFHDILFLPTSNHICLGGLDGVVRMWNWQMEIGQHEPTIAGHDIECWSIALANQRRLLASASDDHTVKIWDTDSGKLIKTLTGHESLVTNVVFSPDETLLATSSFDKKVIIWNVEDFSIKKALSGHTGLLRALDFSLDGKVLVSGDTNGEMKIWRAKDGVLLKSLSQGTGDVQRVRFLSNDKSIIVGDNEHHLSLWDATTYQKKMDIRLDGAVYALACSPDSKWIAAGTRNGSVFLVDATDGTVHGRLIGHTNWVKSLAFSPDGKTLASASVDNTIKLWHVDSQTELMSFPALPAQCFDVAFSRDGRLLASCTFDGKVQLWRTE